MNMDHGLRQRAARELSAASPMKTVPAHDISTLWKNLPTSFHHMEISACIRRFSGRAARLESAENTIGTRLAFREATAFFFAHRDGETSPLRETFLPPRRKT